ncbi:hypothetical protein [Desulfosarcina ovata]|nr:hypothetical protein [Desulfosarcina ovata]
MKRILILMATLFLLTMLGWAPAEADATLDPSDVRSTRNGGHLLTSIDVSGDTNSVTIDLSAGSNDRLYDGRALWALDVTPGTDDEAPSSTIDVTIAAGNWSYTWSGLSNTANSHKSIYEADSPPASPPMVTGNITITISDLGSGATAVVQPIFW